MSARAWLFSPFSEPCARRVCIYARGEILSPVRVLHMMAKKRERAAAREHNIRRREGKVGNYRSTRVVSTISDGPVLISRFNVWWHLQALRHICIVHCVRRFIVHGQIDSRNLYVSAANERICWWSSTLMYILELFISGGMVSGKNALSSRQLLMIISFFACLSLVISIFAWSIRLWREFRPARVNAYAYIVVVMHAKSNEKCN